MHQRVIFFQLSFNLGMTAEPVASVTKSLMAVSRSHSANLRWSAIRSALRFVRSSSLENLWFYMHCIIFMPCVFLQCGVCAKALGDLLTPIYLHGNVIHCGSCFLKTLDVWCLPGANMLSENSAITCLDWVRHYYNSDSLVCILCLCFPPLKRM